jgi:hypothetical protein
MERQNIGHGTLRWRGAGCFSWFHLICVSFAFLKIKDVNARMQPRLSANLQAPVVQGFLLLRVDVKNWLHKVDQAIPKLRNNV